MEPRVIIKPYSPQFEEAVIELWRRCNLLRPWNNPKKDIERKLKVNPELFLLGFIDNRVVATAICGYEGHRGWVNYLAVDPDFQLQGLGKQMMAAAEEKLKALNCPKINIQIRTDNEAAIRFYQSIGYTQDKVVSMGKRLEKDRD